MKVYGLPTYPIYHGMTLGERESEELEWLLEHGTIQSDLYSYKKVIKVAENDYRLVKCRDSRYSDKEEIVAGATHLETLVEMEHLNIAYWYWYGK